VNPPLIFSPPLKQRKSRVPRIKLFERGIKGVSIENQPNIDEGRPILKLQMPVVIFLLTFA
jgi:hypothetical protein